MKHAAVIGAGLGGLASAIHLAKSGWTVSVYEKNDRVGGKMNRWQTDGYLFDTGPTLLTMPFVLKELITATGRRCEEYLDLIPVDPVCRYFFSDGSSLDASSDPNRMMSAIVQFAPEDAEGFERFLSHGERIYRAAAEPFLFSSFTSLRGLAAWRAMRYLPSLARIDAFRTLDECVCSYVKDERLRQLLNRFATYSGSSPYQAPATLAIIPHVEFAMGGWYPRGGMYTIAQALEKIARELGVDMHLGSSVTRLEQNGHLVSGLEVNGQCIPADVVVCNADAIYAKRDLLPASNQPKLEPSLSGFVLLLATSTSWPHIAHHNIFFSNDYKEEFRVLFEEQRCAISPTIYVCNSSVTDRGHAPEGHSNLFVLVNAPPVNEGFDWRTGAHSYRDHIITVLEDKGLTNLRSSIVAEKMITPVDFEERYNAWHGALYGTSSNSRMAAFLRPPNRSTVYRNMYFAGGSAHPGGGIPLVLLSGKHAATLILQDHDDD